MKDDVCQTTTLLKSRRDRSAAEVSSMSCSQNLNLETELCAKPTAPQSLVALNEMKKSQLKSTLLHEGLQPSTNFTQKKHAQYFNIQNKL